MNLRRFIPRLSKFVSDAESEIDDLQELSADDGAQAEYLQMLGIFFPMVLKLICKNDSESVVPKTDLSNSRCCLPYQIQRLPPSNQMFMQARKLDSSICRF